MPKRNIYVSEGLDNLINGVESPVPLARIFEEAVQTFLDTRVCPTCGHSVSVRTIERKPVKKVKRNVRVKVRRT